MVQSDKPFIYDSFMRGFNGSRDRALFSRGAIASKLVNALLAKSWSITIACHEEVENEILGWILHEGAQNIGWICVKGPAQGKWIAHKLLEYIGTDVKQPIFAPFVTHHMIEYAEEHGINLQFRPYLVYG